MRTDRRTTPWACAIALTMALGTAGCGGLSVAQTRPPPSRPIRDIAREQKGEVVSVRDTRIDLRTGTARSLRASTPTVPIAGVVGVRVPVTVGGEKAVEVPAEEITVRLGDGKMIAVVQELSSPPFAPGERVRVIHERVDDSSVAPRIQVVRE